MNDMDNNNQLPNISDTLISDKALVFVIKKRSELIGTLLFQFSLTSNLFSIFVRDLLSEIGVSEILQLKISEY